MIYDTDDFYQIEEHFFNKTKYNVYAAIYYLNLVVMAISFGIFYINDTPSPMLMGIGLFFINIMLLLANGLQNIRTGGGNLRTVYRDLENFAPGFYFEKKEKEVIECNDFWIVEEENEKKLFDSKKSVR